MASSLGDAREAESVAAAAKIRAERPGSDRYQQNHMALIFQQGLSFSGFERNKVFFGGPGMRYLDGSDVSGADSEGDCRASLVADFDDDGDADLFVNAIQRDQHMLYRNDVGPADAGANGTNGFVKLRLRATRGHPDAIGAIVKLRVGEATQARVLSCGTGFESQDAPELVFGLGSEEIGRVSVRWPGREVEDFGEVRRNGRHLLVEGRGEPGAYPARTFRFADPLPRGVRLRSGDRLPQLVVSALDGSTKQLDVAGEKPVLLNFWATTCSSCIEELPALSALHTGGKYRVVGVSLDPIDRGSAVEKVWAERKPSFDTYTIGEEQAKKLFDLPRLGIPLSILLSADGRVERIVQGRIREGDL